MPRFELNYANKEHRSPRYLDINPSGRAPTLMTDGGDAITELVAIVGYLDELYLRDLMILTEPISRGKKRALESVGDDLIVRCKMWLWNLTVAFPVKESTPSLEVAGKAGCVLELLAFLKAQYAIMIF